MNADLDVHTMNTIQVQTSWKSVMKDNSPTNSSSNDRIVLGLLTSVDSNGGRSQRHIAAELDIALGLVNAYLKRSIKKGLVKVSQAPARRYAYYLTPQGFSEKSRLTVKYLSSSFSLFRKAKEDFAKVFDLARARGMERIVLAGKSDLCEIAILCAVERPITIVAVVDPDADVSRFISVNVVRRYADVAQAFDGVVVTDLTRAKNVFDDAIATYGAQKVLAPELLGLRAPQEQGVKP
jgi:DNA-binding MarR family transcriptional regulator